MLEVNIPLETLRDCQERVKVLRGYL
jgi:hypothetical protein